MPSPSRVLWTQGLLLGPQHLREADRYHETLLTARLDALHPHAWGAIRVELDARALERGELALDTFVGVLPDGSFLAFAGGEAEAPPVRRIPASLEGRAKVLLALPRTKEGAPLHGERARFALDLRRVADPERGASVDIPFARPQPTLVLEGEETSDHVVLPVAELERDERGAFRVVGDYVPPAMSAAASPFLMDALGTLNARLRTRLATLREARRERDEVSLAYERADITRFLLLQAIGAELPVLEAYGLAGDVAPRTLFLALLRLAGALGPFVRDDAPLPAYDHLDLRGSFQAIFDEIGRRLDTTTREHCLMVELQGREDGMHLTQLANEELQRSPRYLLAVRSESVAREELGRLVPTLAKIASWGDIGGVVASAMPGAPLRVCHRPPPEIPTRSDETYFDVEASSPFWSTALRERSLAVFLPRPFDATTTQVRLLALPPRAA